MPSILSVYAGRCALPYRIFYLLLWAAIVYPLNVTAVQAADSMLTLSDAMSRAMAQNPRLQVFDLRLDGLQGRRIVIPPKIRSGYK